MSDFEAFWVPRPDPPTEYQTQDVGVSWLRSKPSPRCVVLPSVGQADYLRGLPAHTEVATSRNQYRADLTRGASILVCFPYADTLELAERLRPTAICVADNGQNAVRGWVTKNDATPIGPKGWTGDYLDIDEPTLPGDVEEELEQVIAFDYHNQFIGAGGKRYSICALRRIHQAHPTLSLEDVEAWLLSKPRVEGRGADRLVTWLKEIKQGVQHRDGGRAIHCP